MTWRDLFYLVRRNLLRMKLRVAMTATGVLIGTAAVILVVSLGIGLQRVNEESMSSFGELTEINVYPPTELAMFGVVTGSSEARLDAQTIDEFRDLPGVAAVTPVLRLRGSGELQFKRLSSYPNIIGIDPQAVHTMDFKMQSGSSRLGQWQVIIGYRVPLQFRDPFTRRGVEESLDLQGQTLIFRAQKFGDDGAMTERQVRLRVAGVLAESGGEKDYSIYMSLKDVEDLNTWFTGGRENYARTGYDQVLIKASDSRQVPAIEQQILLQGFYAYSLQTMIQSNNMIFVVIQIVLGSLGGVALLVAGVGIANAMIMAIYERTREIGLMKAVGARNRDVLFVFLAEAGGIGLLGGLSGLLLSLAAGGMINFIAGSYLGSMMAQQGAADLTIPNLVYTPPWLMIAALAFSAFVGVASGIYPALRATRLDPIQALRYE